jgi:gliding motility-associated-like protein
MLIQNVLRVLCCLILFCSLAKLTNAQSCNDWLKLNSTPSYAYSSEIDISGTKLTVEAKFIRTTPYTGGQEWAGDLVSKHKDPVDVNYLLRPNGAEITTTNGYFKTPDVCDIELNKIYHAAMVYDGTTLKFYRNGFLLSEVPATGNLVQNNWRTFIGYYDAMLHPENFIGYIDEVRIWNYARGQDQIRTFMNLTLPVPAGQVGLVAYYTFDDLINKQGDPAYNLTLSPVDAAINIASPSCSYIADSCGTYLPPPDSIIITNNVTICEGTHHQIKTHPADTYIWTPAVFLDDPTSPLPVASPPVSMTYYVEAYRAATNTTLHDSVHIRVVRSDSKANEDTTICAGSPVQMNVSHGTNIMWTPAEGLSDPHTPNPLATPLTTTKYIVIGIGEGRCAFSDTVIITVLPRPNSVVSNDTAICRSAVVQLNATGGNSYEWFPSSNLNNASIPDPIATTSESTMFTVNVKGINGCVKTDTVNVEVRTHPDFKTSGNQSVCEGDNVVLSASGGTSYQWLPASQVNDASSSTTNATLSGPTTIFSVHISENVCNYDTTISMTIVRNPVPEISILKSNDINCAIPTAQLEATGADSYFWTPFVHLDDATSRKPVASLDTTTTFSVTGYTNAGCSSSASVTVNVDNSGVPRFVLPNAFSPNSDGKNDCFGIRRWGNAKIQQFSIYNRWGQLVFQTSNPGECWDGRTGGVLQAAGGYIYIINAATLCGPIKRMGLLTLIR